MKKTMKIIGFGTDWGYLNDFADKNNIKISGKIRKNGILSKGDGILNK